jgi:hypothetical protein
MLEMKLRNAINKKEGKKERERQRKRRRKSGSRRCVLDLYRQYLI